MKRLADLLKEQKRISSEITVIDEEIRRLKEEFQSKLYPFEEKKGNFDAELQLITAQISSNREKTIIATNNLNNAFANTCQFVVDGESIKVLSDGGVVDAYDLDENGKYTQSEKIEIVPFTDKSKRIFYYKRIEIVYKELESI